MELTELFAKISSVFAKNNAVVAFVGKNYSPLLFEKFLKSVCLQIQRDVQLLNLEKDFVEIQMSLQTTFLGQTKLYWFGDLSLISSKKKRSDIIKYIYQYTGPHHIICFLPLDEKLGEMELAQGYMVTIQEKYNQDQIRKMSWLIDQTKSELMISFLNKLFKINKEYSLEQICLLQEYAGLLGKNVDQFFDGWIEKLIVSDVSLFYLSQLFFEKKAEEFFIKWYQIKSYYSDQFWTAFFLDQLFKSYLYISYNGKVPLDQKQITFGLPYSFLRQDWRLYSLFELQAAQQQMYEIDLALKSGGSSYRLEAFFAKFFSGDFT